MWIFDRNASYGGRKPHLFLPFSLIRDQKVNLSYIKRLDCEFLYCCKLMLRLHRVEVYEDKLVLSQGGNIGSF